MSTVVALTADDLSAAGTFLNAITGEQLNALSML
jgi:hypothetical protein